MRRAASSATSPPSAATTRRPRGHVDHGGYVHGPVSATTSDYSATSSLASTEEEMRRRIEWSQRQLRNQQHIYEQLETEEERAGEATGPGSGAGGGGGGRKIAGGPGAGGAPAGAGSGASAGRREQGGQEAGHQGQGQTDGAHPLTGTVDSRRSYYGRGRAQQPAGAGQKIYGIPPQYKPSPGSTTATTATSTASTTTTTTTYAARANAVEIVPQLNQQPRPQPQLSSPGRPSTATPAYPPTEAASKLHHSLGSAHESLAELRTRPSVSQQQQEQQPQQQQQQQYQQPAHALHEQQRHGPVPVHPDTLVMYGENIGDEESQTSGLSQQKLLKKKHRHKLTNSPNKSYPRKNPNKQNITILGNPSTLTHKKPRSDDDDGNPGRHPEYERRPRGRIRSLIGSGGGGSSGGSRRRRSKFYERTVSPMPGSGPGGSSFDMDAIGSGASEDGGEYDGVAGVGIEGGSASNNERTGAANGGGGGHVWHRRAYYVSHQYGSGGGEGAVGRGEVAPAASVTASSNDGGGTGGGAGGDDADGYLTRSGSDSSEHVRQLREQERRQRQQQQPRPRQSGGSYDMDPLNSYSVDGESVKPNEVGSSGGGMGAGMPEDEAHERRHRGSSPSSHGGSSDATERRSGSAGLGPITEEIGLDSSVAVGGGSRAPGRPSRPIRVGEVAPSPNSGGRGDSSSAAAPSYYFGSPSPQPQQWQAWQHGLTSRTARWDAFATYAESPPSSPEDNRTPQSAPSHGQYHRENPAGTPRLGAPPPSYYEEDYCPDGDGPIYRDRSRRGGGQSDGRFTPRTGGRAENIVVGKVLFGDGYSDRNDDGNDEDDDPWDVQQDHQKGPAVAEESTDSPTSVTVPPPSASAWVGGGGNGIGGERRGLPPLPEGSSSPDSVLTDEMSGANRTHPSDEHTDGAGSSLPSHLQFSVGSAAAVAPSADTGRRRRQAAAARPTSPMHPVSPRRPATPTSPASRLNSRSSTPPTTTTASLNASSPSSPLRVGSSADPSQWGPGSKEYNLNDQERRRRIDRAYAIRERRMREARQRGADLVRMSPYREVGYSGPLSPVREADSSLASPASPHSSNHGRGDYAGGVFPGPSAVAAAAAAAAWTSSQHPEGQSSNMVGDNANVGIYNGSNEWEPEEKAPTRRDRRKGRTTEDLKGRVINLSSSKQKVVHLRKETRETNAAIVHHDPQFSFIEAVAAVVIQTFIRRYIAYRAATIRYEASQIIKEFIVASTRKRRNEQKREENTGREIDFRDGRFRMYHIAAMQIQAQFRGWWVRDCLTVDHYCATIIQQAVRGYLQRMNYEFDYYRIVIVQSAVRRYLARREAAQRLEDVTRIQAAYRGHAARKGLFADVRSGKEREEAVIKIQAQWRTRDARVAYMDRLADILVVQSLARRWVTRKLVMPYIKAQRAGHFGPVEEYCYDDDGGEYDPDSLIYSAEEELEREYQQEPMQEPAQKPAYEEPELIAASKPIYESQRSSAKPSTLIQAWKDREAKATNIGRMPDETKSKQVEESKRSAGAQQSRGRSTNSLLQTWKDREAKATNQASIARARPASTAF